MLGTCVQNASMLLCVLVSNTLGMHYVSQSHCFVLYGRYVIPCSGVLAFLLLGIDEIAIQLEEPFGILPLEAICETIKRNLEVVCTWQPLSCACSCHIY